METAETWDEIKQRIEDTQSLIERGNDAYEDERDATAYLVAAIAELLEIAKAQQKEIERLSAR